MKLASSEDSAVATKSLLDQWDREHSWHPFTQMEEYAAWPQLHVERGEGCWLYDTDGNRYLDGNASIWAAAHGHGDPEIDQALKDQIDRVAHSTYLGLSHPNGALLGKKLVESSPRDLKRAVFSDNGSNAVEIALKLSFQYWQLVGKPEKRLIVGMADGYHGDTFGAMSAGNSQAFHGRFDPWLFESRVFPAPSCYTVNGAVGFEDASESLTRLEKILSSERDRLAAVIFEPLAQGPAGMRMQPIGFAKDVERLCRQYGVHLILDEVFVGCGRMGKIFACEWEDVNPDFVCLAKGLSAGYLPLAVTLTTERIYEAFLGDFDSGRAFFHGHTFTGNPLAATVALKSLEKLERLIESGRLERTIAYFGERFEAVFGDHSNVESLRQRGMAAAIDLSPGEGKEPWSLNDRVGLQVCMAARDCGLLLRPLLDSILIVPPLTIEADEIDFLFDNLKKALEATMKKLGS